MNNKVYFPNLDGLRTIACFMVFAFHSLGIGGNRLGIPNLYMEKLTSAFLNGKTGVSIFFVLSGFLITFIILSEIKKKGQFSLGHFYIRRVLRIWPLYFLVLGIIFGLLPLVDHFFAVAKNSFDSRPMYYFTFLSNFDVLRIVENGQSDFLPSTITWSVAIEEQFYLFWPLLFLFIPGAYYKQMFLFIIAFAFGFRLLHYNQPNQLYFHSLSAVFDLAVGGGTAYLCITDSGIKKAIIKLRDKGRILIIISGMVIMYLNALIHLSWFNLVLTAAQALFFAFIIVDQCFNRSERLKFSRSKLLTGLGKYTYGMYMLHPLVLFALNIVLVRIINVPVDGTLGMWVHFCAVLPLTIFVAWLSYNLLEKKFLLLKEKFSFITMSPTKG